MYSSSQDDFLYYQESDYYPTPPFHGGPPPHRGHWTPLPQNLPPPPGGRPPYLEPPYPLRGGANYNPERRGRIGYEDWRPYRHDPPPSFFPPPPSHHHHHHLPPPPGPGFRGQLSPGGERELGRGFHDLHRPLWREDEDRRGLKKHRHWQSSDEGSRSRSPAEYGEQISDSESSTQREKKSRRSHKRSRKHSPRDSRLEQEKRKVSAHMQWLFNPLPTNMCSLLPMRIYVGVVLIK